MYNLFLDDIRNPKDVYYYIKDNRYLNLDWVVVRSYDEFVSYITENGMPSLTSFDHDLADEHYGSHLKKEIYYSDFKEKTGFSCAQWLVNYCLDNGYKLPRYLIHSMNTPGRINIDSYFKTFLRYKDRLH